MPEIIHDIEELEKLRQSMIDVRKDIIGPQRHQFEFSANEAGNQKAANAIHDFYEGWTDGRKQIRESLNSRIDNLSVVITHYLRLQEKLKSAFDQSSSAGGTGSGGGTSGGSTPISEAARSATERTRLLGQRTGSLPDSRRPHDEVIEAYRTRTHEADATGIISDDHRHGGKNDYHCTAWAKYRWYELGFGGEFGTHPGSEATGDGGDMARLNGGVRGGDPTLGAMVSYPGHVMIVEEVKIVDGQEVMRVSEMNTDSDWRNANPSEYKQEREWFRDPETNTWTTSNLPGQQKTMTFAAFPKDQMRQ